MGTVSWYMATLVPVGIVPIYLPLRPIGPTYRTCRSTNACEHVYDELIKGNMRAKYANINM
jgi:hypothetical protein